MDAEHEIIPLAPHEIFRFLRWTKSLNRVDVVRQGRAQPITGHGDHWHYHRAMELTLIEHGTGTRFVADHIQTFRAGDLVLIGSNVPHYWHSDRGCSGMSVQWDFPIDHGIWSFGQTVAPLQSLTKAALHGLYLSGGTALVASRVMAKLGALPDFSRLVSFLQILSLLVAAPKDDVAQLAAIPFPVNGTTEQQASIARAVSHILANYQKRVRFGELLRLTHMSRATFARQFQRHVGKSFSIFVNQVRLQAVCRALTETTDSISSIAFAHGFNQLSFFNRLFRREFRVCPSEYRRSYNGQRSRDAVAFKPAKSAFEKSHFMPLPGTVAPSAPGRVRAL